MVCFYKGMMPLLTPSRNIMAAGMMPYEPQSEILCCEYNALMNPKLGSIIFIIEAHSYIGNKHATERTGSG